MPKTLILFYTRTGNTARLRPGRNMQGVALTNVCRAHVAGNTFAGAAVESVRSGRSC